jgi:hypothetical protein
LIGAAPLLRIPVGVLVERRKAESMWADYIWTPVAVLAGTPETPPWTMLRQEEDRATFYVGAAEVELYRTETGNYRDNLGAAMPSVWVALRPTEGEPPYSILKVTVDPAEGEALTEAGNDLIEAVPMPQPIRELLADFVAQHHVERTVFKRARERADPDALGRRGPIGGKNR